MSEFSSALAGISFAGLCGIVYGYIRLKHHLKEEIVDPDIKELKTALNIMKANFEQRLSKVEAEGMQMSEKIDRKFQEVNAKLDKNSQAVSTMQGMLTAIFNGLRNGATNYGQ